jgi:hypothetical protein
VAAPQAPCLAITLGWLGGAPLLGDESFLVLVYSTASGSQDGYHLLPTWVPGDCGNGVVEPSEQCDSELVISQGICDPQGCVWIPPANDLCADAEDITAQISTIGEITTIVGNSETATNSTSWEGEGFCQSSTGEHVDVHYTFTAPMDGRMYFDLDTPSWDGVVYATEGECGAAVLCNDFPEEIEIDVVMGSRYTIVIDGYSGGSTYRGAFELKLGYLVPPPKDQCDDSSPTALPADGTPVLFSGSTRAAVDDSAASMCTHSSSSEHRDVFYAFSAPIDGTVEVSSDSTWDGLLHARVGCVGAELDCSDTPEEVSFAVTAGQTFVVVVDAWGSAGGEYELRARYDIPPPQLAGGDTCSAATALPQSVGLIEGTLDGATDDYNAADIGGCTGFSSVGPDVVYTIDLAAGETLDVSMTAEDADGAMYIVDACPPTGVSCVDGSDRAGTSVTETATATNTSGGPKSYWIVVDEFVFSGGTPDEGKFDLEWSITP